jgi:hypothetical protein
MVNKSAGRKLQGAPKDQARRRKARKGKARKAVKKAPARERFAFLLWISFASFAQALRGFGSLGALMRPC